MNAAIPFQSVVRIITLNAFFLSVIMAIGMMLSNRKESKNRIFFGLFLAFSLINLYFFLFESGRIESCPYISVVCLSGFYLIGPMLYFLSLYTVNKAFRLSNHFYRHLIPFFLAVVTGISAVYFKGFEHLPVVFDFFFNRIVLGLGIVGSLSLIIYLVMAGRKLVRSFLWNIDNFRNEPPALVSMIIFDVFMAFAIADIASLVTGNLIFLQIAVILLSSCVIILLLINFMYPGFNALVSNVVDKEKQRRTHLSNVDIDNLKIRLNELITLKEIFTDGQLTLNKLAALAGVSSHQLSEYINQHSKKNFTTFINELRIEKAKKLFRIRPEYTIISVAYDVGFNSKSAFNDAFRKITGITPSEFIRENKISETSCPDL